MLEGKAVVLRMTESADVPTIHAIASAGAATLFWDNGALQLDGLMPVLLAHESGTNAVLWTAWRGSEIVGFVSLNDVQPVHRSAEIKYGGVRADCAGSGIATEITEIVLRLAFTTLNLNRVTGRAYASHQPICRLRERAGFRLEGVLQDAVWKTDHWESLNLYAILRSEWAARQTG